MLEARSGREPRSKGRLSLPLYVGETHCSARRQQDFGVTCKVNRESPPRDLGFWAEDRNARLCSRVSLRLETSRPTEYQLELSARGPAAGHGRSCAGRLERVPFLARPSSGVMVEPKAKSLADARCSAREKPKAASGETPDGAAPGNNGSFPGSANRRARWAASGEQACGASLLASPRSAPSQKITRATHFRGQLAEPVAVLPAACSHRATLVEGTVVRSVAPKMLSRAGRLYLRVDRILPPVTGEPLRVGGSMSAGGSRCASSLRPGRRRHAAWPQAREGEWVWSDLGYAYAPWKRSPMILPRLSIRAIGASMSNAAVRKTAARYAGLGNRGGIPPCAGMAETFYLAKYSLIGVRAWPGE